MNVTQQDFVQALQRVAKENRAAPEVGLLAEYLAHYLSTEIRPEKEEEFNHKLPIHIANAITHLRLHDKEREKLIVTALVAKRIWVNKVPVLSEDEHWSHEVLCLLMDVLMRVTGSDMQSVRLAGYVYARSGVVTQTLQLFVALAFKRLRAACIANGGKKIVRRCGHGWGKRNGKSTYTRRKGETTIELELYKDDFSITLGRKRKFGPLMDNDYITFKTHISDETGQFLCRRGAGGYYLSWCSMIEDAIESWGSLEKSLPR